MTPALTAEPTVSFQESFSLNLLPPLPPPAFSLAGWLAGLLASYLATWRAGPVAPDRAALRDVAPFSEVNGCPELVTLHDETRQPVREGPEGDYTY